jgi:two-component system, NarL family, nitrate/nitrite response regulator NarL
MAIQTSPTPIYCGVSVRIAKHRPAKIYVASDIHLLREGIVVALSSHSSVQVVGASDLSVAPEVLAELGPDALILDISGSRSLDFSNAMRSTIPELKIVALCISDVEKVVIPCAEAGVSGFVSAGGSASDVVTAIHSAMRGELVCSPRAAGMLLNHAARPSRGQSNDMLTAREREIASLMSEGMSNKLIARQLGIQNATVKTHVHNILSKMRVRRRGEAAAQLFHSELSGDAIPPGDPPPVALSAYRPLRGQNA